MMLRGLSGFMSCFFPSKQTGGRRYWQIKTKKRSLSAWQAEANPSNQRGHEGEAPTAHPQGIKRDQIDWPGDASKAQVPQVWACGRMGHIELLVARRKREEIEKGLLFNKLSIFDRMEQDVECQWQVQARSISRKIRSGIVSWIPSSNLGPAPRFSHWIKAGASAGSSDPSLGLSAGDQKQMFQQRRGDESGANIWTSSVETAAPVNAR